MTGYVATRWYRAPEIMLKWMRYTKAIDVWSVGCILVEMYTSRPMFPGRNRELLLHNKKYFLKIKLRFNLILKQKIKDVDQLNLILNVVGYPDNDLLQGINQDARNYLEKLETHPTRVNFKEYFSEIKSQQAIDLAESMLQLNPDRRITCEQALEHEFVSIYHDPEDEPIGTSFDDSFEREEFTIAQWKERIFHEIVTFQP
jgi:p38 MAP kinase